MTRRLPRRRWTLALLLALLAGGEMAVSGRAAAGALHGHASAGAGWDTNPLEWTGASHRRGDAFARIDAGMRWESGGATGSGWTAEMRWGAERYVRERSENRHLLLFALSRRFPGAQGWKTFLEVSARAFPQQPEAESRLRGDRDVLRLETGVEGAAARRGTTILWSARLVGLSKESVRAHPEGAGPRAFTSPVERSRAAVVLRGEGRLREQAGWRPFVSLQASGIRHERGAIETAGGGEAFEAGSRRRDGVLEAEGGVSRAGSPSLRCAAAYQRAWSNSYGVAFERVRLDLSAGLLLPWSASAHLLVRWHPLSNYLDDARLVDPLEDPDDPEFGERNRIVLSLRRPLAGPFSVEASAGWHRNEAVVLLEDYEKAVYQLGLRYETPE